MDILEIVRRWLEARQMLPAVDTCGLQPAETGLFPLGQEELSRREDVLGNVTRRVRHSFLLRRTAVPGQSAAAWALQLQQQAAKEPPQLGENQRFWAEKGRLAKQTSTGLGIYEIRLIAETEEDL